MEQLEALKYRENTESNESQKLPGLECATLNFIKDYLVAFSEFIKGILILNN